VTNLQEKAGSSVRKKGKYPDTNREKKGDPLFQTERKRGNMAPNNGSSRGEGGKCVPMSGKKKRERLCAMGGGGVSGGKMYRDENRPIFGEGKKKDIFV